MQLEKLVEEFIIYLHAEKGCSVNTVQAYKQDVLSFLQHFSQDIKTCKEEDLLSFFSTKRNQKYAEASILRAYMALKVFFKFLLIEKILEKDLFALLDRPKGWNVIPTVLTEKEVSALVTIPNNQTFEGARDRAIMEMLYGSGLRVAELCTLKTYDISDEEVRVLGKGQKERIVPMGKKALEAVNHYSRYREHFECETFFLTAKGKPIDRILVWKLVKDYALKAGIKKPVSPHTLRHSYATHILDHGGELRVIQELLGHASIATTDRYTHVSQTKIQEAFKQFHPHYEK